MTKTMVNFNDMEYKRPVLDDFKSQMNGFINQFQTSTTAQEQINIVDKVQQIGRNVSSMMSLCSIRHSINTEDKFYKTEQDFFDENEPLFKESFNEFNKALVTSTFRAELQAEFGEHLFNLIDLELKVFDPKIIDDLVTENKLVTEYNNLIAQAQIEFQGKTLTLSQLTPYKQDTNRQTRKEANAASSKFFSDNLDKFDAIYDNLVKVRDKIAKKLGYQSFVQLGYDRLSRTDYNADSVKSYRQQIIDYIVPLATELKTRQQKRLGLDTLYYYDEALSFNTGNAVPQGEAQWIIEQARNMYSELSPETDEFFTMMNEYGLMDVLSRKGKQAGGYCTTISDYKVPFIFANFNGTQHDVEVMTHEAGHAFQAYLSRDMRLNEYVWPTMEAAEIHSMSMEFFTWDWMNLFFKHQTEKFKFSHLASAIEFLPYGALVDEFQHWVYENVNVTPVERRKKWRELEKKYRPHTNYEDDKLLEDGAYWLRQGHIFSTPFYYIDYTLAQVCALQFWVRLQDDRKTAWQDYLNLCKAGGSRSFLKLLDVANLKNPFEQGFIATIVPKIKSYLDSIDDTKL